MNKQNETKSESENHYKSLLSYFNNLVRTTSGIFVILITIVGILFFQDRASMNEAITESKNTAKQAIENTENYANKKIEEINSKAEKIALDEAKSTVKKILQEKNVETMIDSFVNVWIDNSVNEQIKVAIKESEEKYIENIQNILDIGDAAMRMRLGLRSGLNDLAYFMNRNADANLSLIAKNYYLQIKNDYNRNSIDNFNRKYPNPANIVQPELLGMYEHDTDVRRLIKVLENNDSLLNQIADAFVGLRHKTGENFEMFDFEKVNKWWENNKNTYLE